MGVPDAKQKRISRSDMGKTENSSLEVTNDFSKSSFHGVGGQVDLEREHKHPLQGVWPQRRLGKRVVDGRGCRLMVCFCF